MATPSGLKVKGIIPPKEGWKARTLYRVKVAFNRNNVIHEAVFFSGPLLNSGPSEFNNVWSPYYDKSDYTLSDLYYLKVVEELPVTFS